MDRIRMKLLFSSVLVALIGVLIPLMYDGFCGRAQAAEELVIQTWGGLHSEAINNAYFRPFMEATGVKITESLAGSGYFAKLTAQVKSGNVEWDIVSGDSYTGVAEAGKKGLLEEIDYKIVTNTKDWMPEGLIKWGLGYQFQVNLIIYNTNKFSGDNHPKSWADFFDTKKFPGPRAMHNWGQEDDTLLVALLADGVPVQSLTPIDYDRAFKKLDQIKPHVKVWYTSGDKLMQVLMDQEVVLAHGTDGRGKAARNLGAPIAFEYDKAIPWVSYWSVVKGTRHKKLAMEYLNFIAGRPDLDAIFDNYMGYGTPNKKMIRWMHPKLAKDEAVYPENLKKLSVLSKNQMDWLVDHKTEITEKFAAWLSKK